MYPVNDRPPAPSITIRFAALPGDAELASLWQGLAQRCAPSAFISWPWTRTWLATLPSALKPELMLAHAGAELVAAAIIVRRSVRRRRLLQVPSWFLHTTGEAEHNALCIEHNDLLVGEQHRLAVWRALLEQFRGSRQSVAELYLHGVQVEVVQLARSMGFSLRETGRLPVRHVELDAVRQHPQGLRGVLRHSTRKTLRRTEQALVECCGAISIETAGSAAQASAFLDELRELHERRWAQHESGGAFAPAYFLTFHRTLIETTFATGLVQLLRVRAGDTTVAVLYNLVWQQVAYAYQSGINYGLVGKTQSPGMVAHVQAIDLCAKLGLRHYDLLAGDSQYKQILGTPHTELWWGSVQNHRSALLLEAALEKSVRYGRRQWQQLRRREPEQLQVAGQ
jgi:CelD/BcsL family acetyltransferase involved in cellulose biosynthesis